MTKKFGHLGMMRVIFTYITNSNTFSFNIFIGTIKQIIKFNSYLTSVTNITYSFVPWDTQLTSLLSW